MAQCQKSARSFVRDTFSPCVGVISSQEANDICLKNHLSFVELLLPFSRLTTDVHIKDASGSSTSLQNFSVQFKDAHVLPPQQTLGVRMLTEAVASCCPSQNEKFFKSGEYEINCAVTTPWFEEYRDCFLSIIMPSDHEFIRHYSACLFVVSSSNSDPMSQFAQMTLAQHQQQQQNPAKLPKWFAADLCRYYILLHDCVDGEDSKAEGVYQSMKSKYGVHQCHLLKINSVTPNLDPTPAEEAMPDPWSNFVKKTPSELNTNETSSLPNVTMNGSIDQQQAPQDPLTSLSNTENPLQPLKTNSPARERRASGGMRRPRTRSISERACCLSTHDYDRLKIFVHEFIVRSLIPWAERLIKSYNELYQSKKRGGLFKSLFRGKTTESKPISGNYSPESPEMQLRRLGDLCFMFQLYEQAYSVYHTLKKDFEGDKTWLYCAGTQEMAGLSVFMQGPAAQRNYPTHYLDGAINVYQTCQSQSFMTRAVFLSTEVLKERGLWLQAATQFLKLTGEEFDLRSAVLLEQAAYCYLNMSIPHIRKFSFYMVLAGHRYSKACQRKHSLRCYNVAQQVYENKNWSLAENHIASTISRLSSQLSLYQQALMHSSQLLSESTETVTQQCNFLKDYLLLYQTLRSEGEKSLPDMVVPQIVDNEIMITTDQFDMATNSAVYSDDTRWTQLEEACVIQSQGTLPLILQRSIPSYNRYMKNTKPPRAILGETQFLRIMLYNPLKVSLHLSHISLDWRFHPSGEDDYTMNSKDNPDIVQQAVLPAIELPPLQKQWVLFRLVPKSLGLLNLQSISYAVSFTDSATGEAMPAVKGQFMLSVRGPRLNNTMQEKNSVLYGQDKRLFIDVQPPMPKIKAVFQTMPQTMLCGEVVKVPVDLTNVGANELKNLHVTCSEPNMIFIPEYTPTGKGRPESRNVIALNTKKEILKPTESLSFDVWLRADDLPATKAVNFVFYCENVENNNGKIRHRCCRYSFNVKSAAVLRAQCNTYARTVQNTEQLGSHLTAIMLNNCAPTTTESALEFAVTDILCKSKCWDVSTLDHDSITNVRVNQSEVALLSALLKHSQNEQEYQMTEVHLNSEKVEIDSAVIEGFLSTPLIKPDIEEEDEHRTPESEVAAVVGILWKGFRMDANGVTTQTVGLHCLPVDTISDEVETRSARAPSLNSHHAVMDIPRKQSSSQRKSTEQQNSPTIEYQLIYTSHVTADITQSRVCMIPVTLVMKSYSSEEVAVLVGHESNDDGLLWSGKTNSKVTISPHNETTLKLNVTVLRHGVFNLSSLTVTPEGNCNIRAHSNLPSLLTVDKG